MQSNPKSGKYRNCYSDYLLVQKYISNRRSLQADSDEPLPEHQLGFRRILAGIYTHTSGHLVAAPMAHFNAINGSRFKYSHDTSYLPVHGLAGILKKEIVTMRFRYVKGKQVSFHKGINYLYRPTEMEDLALYWYYLLTEFILISRANQHYFEYTEEHLFRKTEAVIYRKRKAIPIFPWNYLSSTSSFLGSIMDPVDENASDHEKKEEYAFRFMLLFIPFRTREDIQVDGSYQKALQRAHANDRISEETMQIAENIQTIHNSLASGIPENSLTAQTVLLEAADFDNTKPKEDDSYEDILAGIGEVFSTLTTGHGLEGDSKTFDIKFGNRRNETKTVPETRLETIIEFTEPVDNNKARRNNTEKGVDRWTETKQAFNTLALTTVITRSQASEDQNDTRRTKINANGTWQSIVKWGENDGLDAEQQTAFEILAATYVLSFYDDATTATVDSENYQAFNEGEKHLNKLARREFQNGNPLVMFITGPAGAGKCKSKRNHDSHQ
jgi:hypothetical protein